MVTARLVTAGTTHPRRRGRTRIERWSTSACISSTTPAQAAQGTAPYFYLPKLVSPISRRGYNHVFGRPGRPRHPRRDHQGHRADRRPCLPPSRWTRSSTSCADLHGRPGHVAAGTIFSHIKRLGCQPWGPDPDRALMGMDRPAGLFAETDPDFCHRRGYGGGMAAQIPVKGDPGGPPKGLRAGADGQERGRRRSRRHLRPTRPGSGGHRGVRPL